VKWQSGLILSLAAHGILVSGALLLFASAKPFQFTPQRAILVDVITPAEAEQEKRKQETAQSNAADRQANPADARQAPPQPQPQAPADEQQASLPSIDAGELLPMYNMRVPANLDARKAMAVELRQEEITAFKAHLRKCWRLPPDVATASTTRVVMRVTLNPNGGLAGEPALVEASAAEDGPDVFQAALRAIVGCAPYAFLPRDRYKQWQVLDVGISPRDMAGG
jgi:hypothetical protein